MKILFCVRHSFYDIKGGAYVQVLKTKEYLERLGVICDITTTPYGVDYNQYDILHLTDLTWVYDNLLYMREISGQKYNGKKVLSTIYWPFDDYAKNGTSFIQQLAFKLFGINGFEALKSLAKFLVRREAIYLFGLQGSYLSNQRKIVAFADLILPNAQSEMEILNRRLELSRTNYSIVNNAIDTALFDTLTEQSDIQKKSDLITFVARIDPRKNQLNFLKAMMDTKYVIRFIGDAGPNSLKYLEKLKSLARQRGNVEFIPHLPQEEVFKHMLEAKVNVLTSWIETPGLASLEAAYAGCNIVVSDKGSVREYFKDYAYYCNPDDIAEIKEKVLLAINSEFDKTFKTIIKNYYSWERTAEQTSKAYKSVLKH